MERHDFRQRHGFERAHRADRQVAVRVRSVKRGCKRAIGDRRRHVAQLPQAVRSQLPHAVELVSGKLRPRDDVGHQLEGATPEPRKRREGEERGVGPDLGVELRAQPRQRFVQFERAVIAGAFIEHVAGERREARPIVRILRRSHAHQQHHRLHRDVPMLDRPDREAVRQRRFANRRKRERGVRGQRRETGSVGHVSGQRQAPSRQAPDGPARAVRR